MSESSAFGGLPPKTTFIAGLVFGVLLVGTVGFVYLLTKGDRSLSAGKKPAAQVAVAPDALVGQPSVAAPPAAVPDVTDNDHIRGAKNANVTIVEYSDFECPFCKRFHPTVQQAMKEYEGKIRWIYRHFPLDSIHPNARPEAEAAECVARLAGSDKFWEYTDKIFERTTSNGLGFALDKLVPLAKEIGVDEKKMKTCVDKKETASAVEDQYQGGVAAGVRGTPGSFVNGIELGGAVPYEELKRVIEQALKT